MTKGPEQPSFDFEGAGKKEKDRALLEKYFKERPLAPEAAARIVELRKNPKYKDATEDFLSELAVAEMNSAGEPRVQYGSSEITPVRSKKYKK